MGSFRINLHRDVKTVVSRASEPLAPTMLVEAALAVRPGAANKYVPPIDTAASAEVGIKTPAGEKVSAFVDPYDGKVLGEIPDKGTFIWVVRRLHSLPYFGPVANGVIEIVGGWTILLVGTRIYLWRPRRQGGARLAGGVVSVRGKPGQRLFWRDLHAVAGIFTGFFIFFLAITGVPMSDQRMSEAGPTAWSLEQAQIPQSSGHAGHEATGHSGGTGAASGNDQSRRGRLDLRSARIGEGPRGYPVQRTDGGLLSGRRLSG